MIRKESKNDMRIKRHRKIRRTLSGTDVTPRLCVFRSNQAIYAQLIDDVNKITLVSASTTDKELKAEIKNGGNVEAAKLVGKKVAERAVAAGLKSVVFDRSGYIYTGRVKALADAAREAGLEF